MGGGREKEKEETNREKRGVQDTESRRRILAHVASEPDRDVLMQELDRHLLEDVDVGVDVTDGLTSPDVAETVDFEEGLVGVTGVVDEGEVGGDVDEAVLVVELELREKEKERVSTRLQKAGREEDARG